MQILNKITVKAVCGELKNLFTLEEKQAGKDRDIMKVIGNVKNREEIKGQYGTSWKLKGEFKAVNIQTGEEFFSGACFLPGLAEELVIGQMDDIGDNSIQFAFIIGIKPAENKVGYEYIVKPLIKPAENNALTLIESKIKEG